MSIASDLRSYADTAVAQGRQALDQAIDQALNLDSVTAAVDPYLEQVKEYTSVVTEKLSASVEALLTAARKDPRVDRLVLTAESLGAVLLGVVNERVLKPVVSFTGAVAKPTPTNNAATKPATEPATKPATEPTAAKATARTTPARKTAARKTPARKTAAKAAGNS